MQGGYQGVAVQFFGILSVCCYVFSIVFWVQFNFTVNFEKQDCELTIQHSSSLVISEKRFCLQLNGVVTTTGPC